MASTAIHTEGTAPTQVTRSSCTIWMMSRGCGLGPPKICVEPFITPANGTHQAFAWNIGTMWRMTSLSETARTSFVDEATECRKIARCV